MSAVLAVGCTGDDDGGSGGGATEETAAFCDRFGDTEAMRADFSLFDPENPDEAVDSLREATGSFGRLAGVAPDEVRDDVDTMIDVLDRVADEIAELEVPEPAAVFEIVERFDDELVEAEDAASRVEDYAEEHCDAGDARGDGGGGGGDDEVTTTTS